MISDEDLQQYKIPEGWSWKRLKLSTGEMQLELYPTEEETEAMGTNRRPVVLIQERIKGIKTYSWHEVSDDPIIEMFPTIHEAIQYLVTLVGLGMYTI